MTFSSTVLTAGTLSLVTSEPGLSANDTYDWTSFGSGSSGSQALPNGTSLTTQNGLGFEVKDPADMLFVTDPSTTAFGTPGDSTTDILVAGAQEPQKITFRFSDPVSAFGAFVSWGGYENATYKVTAFGPGHTKLDTVKIKSDPNGDWAFIGVDDTTPEIDSIVIKFTGETPPHTAAVGDLFFVDTAVPEPATLLLTGAALLAALTAAGYARRN